MTEKEKRKLILRHFEAEVQLIHDRLVQLVTEVNQIFNRVDKLKKL